MLFSVLFLNVCYLDIVDFGFGTCLSVVGENVVVLKDPSEEF